MLNYLWDGEMDFGWEDLAVVCNHKAKEFCSIISKCSSFSCNFEISQLLTEESICRFLELSQLFSDGIKDGIYYQYQDIDNFNTNAVKLTSWILLGSLTEFALQIYLTIYLDDYKDQRWQQWDNFDTTSVKQHICSSIDDLTARNSITTAQSRSLKEAIKREIKLHTQPHPIEKVMLDELIQFIKANQILDQDAISYLENIRSNRNGIHAFMKREIGTWFDLQYATRFWVYLLDYIISCMPDIPDEFNYYNN